MSAEHARAHTAFLVETAAKDVEEVKVGLPKGADVLGRLLETDGAVSTDPKAAERALAAARRQVQELRIAKSTFFALSDPAGLVVRNDQDEDRMAGKPLFGAFPGLERARAAYVETSGSLPEASGVRAPRPDGQWVAGYPIQVGGQTKALYVTGWSWSSYAYRLEFALRGRIRSDLADRKSENEPLVYVFVVVGRAVYGAPVSPDVDRETIAGLDPLAKANAAEPLVQPLEITGRAYGLSVQRAPALGSDVGIAVLRSET